LPSSLSSKSWMLTSIGWPCGPRRCPVLEFADQLLLLCVDRYDGLTGRLKRLDLGVDMLELSVAIGMFAALLGLPVEMAAIFQCPQRAWQGSTNSPCDPARGAASPACRGSWRPIATAASDHIVASSSKRSKSPSRVGSLLVNRGPPPPVRRTFPVSESRSAKSFRPRPIVLRAIFVVRAAAAIPP
jgi:hypothetical protein